MDEIIGQTKLLELQLTLGITYVNETKRYTFVLGAYTCIYNEVHTRVCVLTWYLSTYQTKRNHRTTKCSNMISVNKQQFNKIYKKSTDYLTLSHLCSLAWRQKGQTRIDVIPERNFPKALLNMLSVICVLPIRFLN